MTEEKIKQTIQTYLTDKQLNEQNLPQLINHLHATNHIKYTVGKYQNCQYDVNLIFPGNMTIKFGMFTFFNVDNTNTSDLANQLFALNQIVDKKTSKK